MTKRNKTIGIIAEDESDVNALKEIIKNISNKDSLGFKNFVGRGCGKIKRKCGEWASQLKVRGCDTLILIHDLDRNNHSSLHASIQKSLKPYVIKDTFISIPIQEMEAWFLADPESIKKALNLPKLPRIQHNPETINSPKEVLRDVVSKFSDDTKIYINTTHNVLIAKSLKVETVIDKCHSFKELYNFVKDKV